MSAQLSSALPGSDFVPVRTSEVFVVAGVSYLREELIHRYMHLVKFVVGRMSLKLPPNVDTNDLINEGVIGLIDAIRKYDDSRNVKFETYAITRIYGTIVDSIRALDWAPRHVRTFGKQTEEAWVTLVATLGRSPSREEISKHLGISLEAFEKSSSRVSLSSVFSLEDTNTHEQGGVGKVHTFGDLVRASGSSVSEDVELSELRESLRLAIGKLNLQERLVIEMYYFETKNLKEIASVLSVSETRVSQIHSRAVVTLRLRLKSLRDELGIRENDPTLKMKYLASAKRVEERHVIAERKRAAKRRKGYVPQKLSKV